ncbi:MAG: class aldolase/adducin family protein [Pseudonocardiales bacterium]|nr:class aldolase/adducin family protein [Pseudonocardiales bacterium]
MATQVADPESAFTPPVFERVEDERQYRKQRLVGAFRIFSKLGFEEGLAGHITARDPELTDHFWVNPVAQPFGFMRVGDLVLVDSNGRIVEGTGPINGAAFAIHSQIHEAWPEVVSAAHSHSIYGRAWSALGRRLDPITQDACLFYNRHALFDDYTGAVLSLEEGKRIAHTLRPRDKAVILRNHGLLSVGAGVEEATWNYVALERCCQVQLLAEAAGTPTLIRPEIAEEQAKLVSDIGWASFQPLWRKVLREQPDLLD